MQLIRVFARTGAQAKMVQADAALSEAIAIMLRSGWLDTDRCPSANAIEQLLVSQTGVMPKAGKSLRRRPSPPQIDLRSA